MPTPTEVQSNTTSINTTANAEKGSAMSQSTEAQSNRITTDPANAEKGSAVSPTTEAQSNPITTSANAEKGNAMSPTTAVQSNPITTTTANAEKGNTMSLSTDVQSNPLAQFSVSDNNLLKHGGEVAVSVTEVGGNDPNAVFIREALNRGAGTMELRAVELAAANDRLTRYKDRNSDDVPIIKEAAFGVAKGIRYAHPATYKRLPLQSEYEKQEPIYFIDRCLVAMELDPATFGGFINVFQVLRRELVEIQTGLIDATAALAVAKREFKVARSDFQKHIREAHTYVLKHAPDGSAALNRLKHKGGGKKNKKKEQDPPVSTTPVPGTATTPVAPIAAPQPAAAPAANDSAQIKIA